MENGYWIDKDEDNLAGTLHLPKDQERPPIVVLCHGFTGHKNCYREFVDISRELCDEGFAVYRFDFLGSGESTRDFQEQTHTTMLEDLDSVVSEFEENNDTGDEIFLIGHSQGGFIAKLFTSENNDRIQGLISWMGRAYDIEDWWSDRYCKEIEKRGFIYANGVKITDKYYQDSKKYSIEESFDNIDIPVQLIYGTHDYTVPLDEGERVNENIQNSNLEVIDGLNHDLNQTEQLLDKTLEFLKTKSDQK
jgi:pimeloyl-ACP methyl ester carboxylesterase